jgi:nucleolar complex protein 2
MRIASSAVYNKLMLFVLVSGCIVIQNNVSALLAGLLTGVLLFVKREIDGIFRSILLDGASSKQLQEPLSGGHLVKLPRWKKLDPLVKSYLGNTLHLLGEHHEQSQASARVYELVCPHILLLLRAGALTDAAMLAFILRRLRASTVFLAPFEKLQRRLLKAALGLFGSADSAPRVQAILLVRQMALDLPQPALDNCLKVSCLHITKQ